MTLADVLAPVTVEEFLRDCVGQRHLQLPGTRNRFRGLATWQELNAVLSGLRVNDGRVRLVKQGRNLPQASYVFDSPSGRIQYLVGPLVNRSVLNGATLILNHVDELLPEVRRLVESCEDVFEVHIGANLYAGWRTDNGFDVHWDKHDTLILQVLGEKNWKVWHPTRVHPIAGDMPDAVPPPTEDPIWHGLLKEGGILYMPRGWWHVAWPCDQPSLHITISIKHPTGADLLEWLVRELRDSTAIRDDVPHWKNRRQQGSWLQAVRDACAAALHDGVVCEYLDSLVDGSQPRPIVRLPKSTQPVGDSEADCLLRLVHVRKLRVRAGRTAAMLMFRAGGRRWECNALLGPALERLHAIVPCSWIDLLGSVEERARPLVRPFVSSLISADVVWLERLDTKAVVQPVDLDKAAGPTVSTPCNRRGLT